MEMKQLGRTGQMVSRICLGTMTWGEQNTLEEGFAQMDYAVERGINFFDTAEMYAIPPKAETYGATETIIGKWFAQHNNRDKIILASKVAGRTPATWMRPDGSPAQLSKEHINTAIDQSLQRLQTDYIDLYQVHWPDRRMNLFGNKRGYQYRDDEFNDIIGETLTALDGLVKAGKVRWLGVSNETPWGVMEYLRGADQGLSRIASIQNCYNLLVRGYEDGLAEITHREDVSLLAYSPLAQGYLSGKYLGGARPAGARTTLFERGDRYEKPTAEAAIQAYVDLAKQHGLDPSVMANAFVNRREFVASNIIGATTMEQLKLCIDSEYVELSEEILTAINAIHENCPNPCT